MAIGTLLRHIAGDPAPARLRKDLQHSDAPEMILRRAVIGASVAGIAAMTAVTLYQSGVVRKLPDPTQRDLGSDSRNASKEAYRYGTPDGPLSILTHATSILFATLGGRKRAKNAPWLALAATASAAPAAMRAVRYLFYQMPVKERAWSGYCVADGLAHIAAFGFTLYESGRALRFLPKRLKRKKFFG